jgi:ABC-type multidrug transport system fused ATPase/permease subunit
MTQPILQLLGRLWRHISPRRRGQFALLLFLMIIASFAEILSIGAVLPFLAILTAPASVFGHPAAQPFIQTMELTEPKQLLLPLTVAFGLAAVFAGGMRLLLLWASTRLSYAAGADLSIGVYRRTLYQPYAVHVERNSSEIIDGISNKTNNAIYLVNMSLNFISASIMLSAILIALMLVDPITALVTFGGFGFIYILIIQLTRKRMLVNSQTIARESVRVIKCLQEGLGGIRDVLIDGSQAAYCKFYAEADQPYQRAQASKSFINFGPRYGVEALGMVIIAALAYTLTQQDASKAIPILGALALGAQRLLPVLQQAYFSWSSIKGGQQSLQDALELLDQPLPAYLTQPAAEPLPFQKQISLKQISFRYSAKTPVVLKNLSLTVPKGGRVGFMGTTGSGKSTLLDIVMGLLQPTSGTIEIDGKPITPGNYRAWQAHIAHVPQTIFLADSSIEENIAFGVLRGQINHDRVRKAAQQAQIADIIESWPEQYKTLVGERGIRLSGGQRQRIGIARALYRQVDVIILDEATSALDNQTEEAVMQSIETLDQNLTLFIVAHRLTTLKNCKQVVELSDGFISRVGTFNEIVTTEAQVH